MSETFILTIEWEVEGLPRTVGPFATKDEARIWAGRNIPNGSWDVSPLAPPHVKARGERAAEVSR